MHGSNARITRRTERIRRRLIATRQWRASSSRKASEAFTRGRSCRQAHGATSDCVCDLLTRFAFACAYRRRLLQQNWNHLTVEERSTQRNFALNFLANSGPACANFVAASLVQLLATVTKLGWMDLEVCGNRAHGCSRTTLFASGTHTV